MTNGSTAASTETIPVHGTTTFEVSDVATRRRRFLDVVTDPRVDRVVAIVASVPFAFLIYYRFVHQGGLTLPWIAMTANMVLLIVTMAARRPPVRVTTKPLYWVTAFVATYWSFMMLGFTEKGIPIAPTVLSDGLAIVSMVIALSARISLGRNIGFVPAQREIVTSWAYAIVRHPVYTALFISIASFLLRAYSPRNLAINAIFGGLFVVKTFMEEDFLRADPTYARYMKSVRWRWVPGVA